MAWINTILRTKALYWAPPTKNGLGGYSWTYADEIRVRWQDSGRELKYDESGSEIVSGAVVWTKEENLLVGGYLIRSNLYETWDLSKPPIDDTKNVAVEEQIYARQIVDIEKVESISIGKRVLTKVWLK